MNHIHFGSTSFRSNGCDLIWHQSRLMNATVRRCVINQLPMWALVCINLVVKTNKRLSTFDQSYWCARMKELFTTSVCIGLAWLKNLVNLYSTTYFNILVNSKMLSYGVRLKGGTIASFIGIVEICRNFSAYFDQLLKMTVSNRRTSYGTPRGLCDIIKLCSVPWKSMETKAIASVCIYDGQSIKLHKYRTL